MNKKQGLTKDRLIHYLLITSIIVILIIGLYFLKLLMNHSLTRIANAIGAVLIPFVIAFFLSFIIGPLSQMIHIKLRIKRGF
ncbi:MAG: hypothetical protein WC992_03625, partial [Acholeplasmataceae bacterium]